MKSFTRVFLFSFLFLLLSIPIVTSAQQPVMVAGVDVIRSKIADQVGNVINIPFTLHNTGDTQTDVRYSVRLVSKTDNRLIVDEGAYADSLVISRGETIDKNIVYTAPATLSGAYTISLVVGNGSGLPLAVVSVGDVTLSASEKGLFVDPSTCVINTQLPNRTDKKTFPLFAQPLVVKGGTNTISCIVSNTAPETLTVSALIEVYPRTFLGEEISLTTTPLSFEIKTGEKKTVSIPLDIPSDPELYRATLTFMTETGVSNTIPFGFLVNGSFASILNATTDKEAYERGENAVISVLWTSVGVSVASVETKLLSGFSVACGNSVTTEAVKGKTDVTIAMKRACDTPSIAVKLLDKDGNILAEKMYKNTQEQSPSGIFAGKKGGMILFGIIILLALGTLVVRKRHNTNPPTAPIAVVLFFLLSFSSISTVQAGTFIDPNNHFYLTVNLQNQTVPGTTYEQGHTMRVDASIDSYSPFDQDVTLSAITVGNTSVQIFNPSTQNIGPSNPRASGSEYFIVSVPTSGGNPVPGTYYVDFTAGVDDTIPVYQNYWYESNLGGILGICRVVPDPYAGIPGYLIAKRDVATEMSATARGVSYAEYTFHIRSDNYPSPQTSIFNPKFASGDLEIDLGVSELNHDAGGYCSTINCEGYLCPDNVQEYF